MSNQRTVTKVIFHDSSDDEATDATNTGVKKPLVTTTIVDVRTDTLCMDEDDMVDPEEHLRRCGEEAIDPDNDDLFVEDALPDLEKAKGTLAHNHSNTVEVAVMDAPANRVGGFVANRRPGRRPEDATSAHSTRKRLRDDEDEEATAAPASTDEGMTTDEMLSAADAVGLPAPATGAVDALDGVEEEVVKALMLPNGTNRDPLAIKMTTDGYRLSLDEFDVQEVFEDEEGEEDEEEDEEAYQMELLMAVSAIEQMIGACERYQPNEEDGGMCPWAVEAEAAAEGEAAAASGDSDSAAAVAPTSSTAAPAVVTAADEAAPVAEASPATATTESVPAEDAAATTTTAPALDANGNPIITKRLIHRPRIFDAFVEKGKDLLAKLQAKEITAEELCEAMEDDVEQLQKAFRRINRPTDEPIYIDGVKMDF